MRTQETTGRRTQSSASRCMAYRTTTCAHAVGDLREVAGDDALVGLQAGDDFGDVAGGLADGHDPFDGAVAINDEHAPRR